MEKGKIEILEFQDSVLALPCYKYICLGWPTRFRSQKPSPCQRPKDLGSTLSVLDFTLDVDILAERLAMSSMIFYERTSSSSLLSRSSIYNACPPLDIIFTARTAVGFLYLISCYVCT
jgi:hypothetical protein